MISYYQRRIIIKLFKLDLWHQSLINSRNYAQALISHISSIQQKPYDYVIDIGCGLGEISSQIRSRNRILIDTDPRIVLFLKFKYFFKIFLGQLSVYASLTNVTPFKSGHKNLYLILNFTHNLEFDVVHDIITQCIELSDTYTIYIDTVNAQGYKIDHERRLRSALSDKDLTLIKTFSDGRKIWSIQPNGRKN